MSTLKDKIDAAWKAFKELNFEACTSEMDVQRAVADAEDGKMEGFEALRDIAERLEDLAHDFYNAAAAAEEAAIDELPPPADDDYSPLRPLQRAFDAMRDYYDKKYNNE